MSEDELDFLIVGSGFGGSVSALRLAERGYRVAVIEAGKRWRTEDFPRTSWSLRKFLWLPKLFCYGIQRLTLLDDVMVLSGAGVGGGSLVYANTLLVPPKEAFQGEGWPESHDFGEALEPHYQTALKMLGATMVPKDFPADLLLKRAADESGYGETYRRQQVGVFFGEPGKVVPDPFFDGKGPERAGCNFCGGCMVGCRFNAKNTLDKNYLHLAEALGVEVIPERLATVVRAIDGGYEVETVRSTRQLLKDRKVFRAKNVVVSAGGLGTLRLLLRSKREGALPKLSDRLGRSVRTNNESIIGSTARDDSVDYSTGVAIGSSIHIDDRTHIEAVRYSKGSNAMSLLASVLCDGGGRTPRIIRWLGAILRHPIDLLRSLSPFHWARRTLILLVMQTLDGKIRVSLKRRWWAPFSERLSSTRPPDEPKVPTYIPRANAFARKVAEIQNGFPSSSLNEVLLDIPLTAHILGGCTISDSPERGVVAPDGQAFGHPGLYVVDGSIVPANLGVNPSLTITALAEWVMSQVPPKGDPP